MGSCIICGTSVDGRICDLHQEDVVFEFRGRRPDELTPGRYYRGSVDGFAEFGVFIDIGDSVTGLLHKSELDQRLDSLDWDSGETVFVQVKSVRDNGNIDLGWSIRQGESEFRGTLVDDPDNDGAILKEDADETDESDSTDESSDSSVGQPEPRETEPDTDDEQAASAETEARDETEESDETADAEEAPETEQSTETDAQAGQTQAEAVEATISELGDKVGSLVRIEGEIADARQTSGPTVFELRDETGTVDCAAFEEAGVRAYPEVDEGDVVRIEGEVEKRRGELQVETEALVVLEDEERDAVTQRMEDAMLQRARPDALAPLAEDPAVESVTDSLLDAATAIRRAVLESRPIVVRHSATADGYVAGVAIERATLPLIREEHQSSDAEYHYFDRRPLEESVYDMDDATGDVTQMLSNRERHGEKYPLFVFVAAAGTAESLDGLELLDVYGARRVVVDERAIDDEIVEEVDTLVAPSQEGAPETTATALAATIASGVNSDVQQDLEHLPAVSFWEDAPEAYVDLATDAGYDTETISDIREAIALEAYYQSYEDKRELIIDLLFAEQTEDVTGLAGHVSEQFRTKMDTEVETAEENLEEQTVDGESILVLDTEAYTHRYEFPPTELLLDELFRRHREDAVALVGFDTDEAYVRSDADIDVRAVVDQASEEASEAGLDARGAREGRIEFLAGERDAVQDAVLAALAVELSTAPAA
ncbi:DHH family phosphoesterase [Salinibaculum rarum]|uniref:DHH family phosphoesterase n=1 Tax=Salinibaculum rarum TaxID=3058903 RepID=UPI00265E0321|nr:OB-fold nucleic acid binding domain-containing protein [Salinibaculum sp. KK48]